MTGHNVVIGLLILVALYVWIAVGCAAVCYRFSTVTAPEKVRFRLVIGTLCFFWPLTAPGAVVVASLYMIGSSGEMLSNILQRVFRVQSDEEEEEVPVYEDDSSV